MHIKRFKYTVNHVNANHFKNKGKLYYIKQKHDGSQGLCITIATV